jgi:hypothetical protein
MWDVMIVDVWHGDVLAVISGVSQARARRIRRVWRSRRIKGTRAVVCRADTGPLTPQP